MRQITTRAPDIYQTLCDLPNKKRYGFQMMNVKGSRSNMSYFLKEIPYSPTNDNYCKSS